MQSVSKRCCILCTLLCHLVFIYLNAIEMISIPRHIKFFDYGCLRIFFSFIIFYVFLVSFSSHHVHYILLNHCIIFLYFLSFSITSVPLPSFSHLPLLYPFWNIYSSPFSFHSFWFFSSFFCSFITFFFFLFFFLLCTLSLSLLPLEHFAHLILFAFIHLFNRSFHLKNHKISHSSFLLQ